MPDGIAPPKSNDVTAWVALLAKAIAPALPTHVCADTSRHLSNLRGTIS